PGPGRFGVVGQDDREQVRYAGVGGIVASLDQTGAGVLDVFDAVRQKVLSAPAVQGGRYNWPQHTSDRTTVQVPFTKLDPADGTLTSMPMMVLANALYDPLMING
ncbi:hypothetical protein PUR49_36825, partial [Streptomyces sp. BE147]|uniref:hypothetical protein n=1 Tax=Streptomyces sp. BE147 TaxID=3002524 RepID=UPI002E77D50F